MSSNHPSAPLAQDPARVAGTARLGGAEVGFDVADARTYSLGVRFRGAAPEVGAELDEVTVTVGTQSHALGRCRVLVDGDGGAGAFRVAPVGELIHCRDVVKHGRVVRAAQSFEQLPLLWARKDAIHPEFARYTAALVYDLQVYRERFDELDAAVADESSALQEEIRARVLDVHGPGFFAFFDARLRALEDLVRDYSRVEHERHGYYFRRHVWNFIAPSAFLWRTNVRPRGYAGDSLMMRFLYENRFEGASIFGRLMHKHPVESAAAQAVRNRRRMIVEALAEVAREQPRRPLRLMSVACGPAWEVRDLFGSAEDCGRFAATLLDQDEEALGEAEQEIGNAARRTGTDVKARFVRDSVRTMLRTRDLAARFGRHEFIYSMGLFDYLTAPVAKTVLAKLYDLLEPGGRLLVGNYHVGNPTRVYMEYWMDWALLYRTEEDLLELARELPGARATVFFDATRSQAFLDVRKPAA